MTTEPERILVVDDNELTRQVLHRRLVKEGYAVTEADGGERAVELVRTRPFDLVLLDLMMPELDGLATLIRIRTTHPITALPVVILSAHEGTGDVVEALHAGANDFTAKSSDFAVILARINNQLALRRLHERIRNIAVRDELTGLYNRRGFQELAEREEKRHHRHGNGLQAILLDLDHFKEVNDEHGHRIGDLVLIRTAEACRSAVRATDLLSRWGGEEFAVLLPETNLEGAIAMAERLRTIIAELRIETPAGRIPVTLSAGVAPYDSSCRNLLDLMRHADRALYEAKRKGRNRVCVCKEHTGVR